MAIPLRVLIVEDEPMISMCLEEIVEGPSPPSSPSNRP